MIFKKMIFEHIFFWDTQYAFVEKLDLLEKSLVSTESLVFWKNCIENAQLPQVEEFWGKDGHGLCGRSKNMDGGDWFLLLCKVWASKKRLGDTAIGENVIKIGQSIRGVFAHHSLG